ncbi:MAG: hypothetical protein IJQ28_06825, partial [Clostridia bacterium]|nr:hypothetical protein [Clostridia bacterium]
SKENTETEDDSTNKEFLENNDVNSNEDVTEGNDDSDNNSDVSQENGNKDDNDINSNSGNNSEFNNYDYEISPETLDANNPEKNGEFVSANNPYRDRWEDFGEEFADDGKANDWDSLKDVPFAGDSSNTVDYDDSRHGVITDDLANDDSNQGDVKDIHSKTPYEQLSDYMSKHNYGSGDFSEYSQDPEWRELQRQAFPDYEMPPISKENAFNQLGKYMSDNGYGPDDFATYSQDPKWRELQSFAYPDYQLPPLSQDNNLAVNELEEGYDIKDISDIEKWIGDINPNFDEFDPESPYSNNCGSCAWSVYNRLNGNTDMCATADNIGYNNEMNALTGMEQTPMNPSEIEQRLLSEGNGSHAIIGVDRAMGPGHWFNAVCVNNKVYALDGQTGQINDWPPNYGNVVNWEMSVKKGAN